MNLHFASILIERLCHDMAGLISGVRSGVDCLSHEDIDQELIFLLSQGINQSCARLELYRFAFSFNNMMEISDPLFFQKALSKRCDIQVNDVMPLMEVMDHAWQKILVNALICLAEGAIKDGQIHAKFQENTLSLSLSSQGYSFHKDIEMIFSGNMNEDDLDLRAVYLYHLYILCCEKKLSCQISCLSDGIWCLSIQ